MDTDTAFPQVAKPDPISHQLSVPPKAGESQVALTANERVVFVEEGEPNQYLKVVASGDLDEILLDALSDYVNRQKRRLSRMN